MTRGVFIEMVVRNVYGEQPVNDASITTGLVNTWIEPGIGLAVKQAYKDSIAFDGVSYINNSFYTQFKGLPIVSEEPFVFKIELPQIPKGVGKNEGVNILRFRDADGNMSDPAIPLSETQLGYARQMRKIPNKQLFWPEGKFAYVLSTLQLFNYTANATMISGGDPSDLDSELNVPADYLPIISDYCIRNLARERMTPKDTTNDKRDN
jgi:hypothetical protein